MHGCHLRLRPWNEVSLGGGSESTGEDENRQPSYGAEKNGKKEIKMKNGKKNGKKLGFMTVLCIVLFALVFGITLTGCTGKGDAASSGGSESSLKAVAGKGGVLTLTDFPDYEEGKYVFVMGGIENDEEAFLYGAGFVPGRVDHGGDEWLNVKGAQIKDGKAAVLMYRGIVDIKSEISTWERFFGNTVTAVTVYTYDREDINLYSGPDMSRYSRTFTIGKSNKEKRAVFKNGSARRSVQKDRDE